MDTKLKRKWITSLRSGKYRQGQSFLKYGGRYCCLGVLAAVQGCGWRDDTEGMVPIIKGKQVSSQDDDSVCYLMPRFAGGLPRRAQAKLATMNDTGKSFGEIADYIAKHL